MDPHPPTDPVVASAFFEAAPAPLLVFDAASRIAQANAEAIRFFGYPHEALLAMTVEDLVPERLRGGHVGRREGYQDARDRRPLHGLKLVARHRDGRARSRSR